jgi:hypothetical protein
MDLNLPQPPNYSQTCIKRPAPALRQFTAHLCSALAWQRSAPVFNTVRSETLLEGLICRKLAGKLLVWEKRNSSS